MNKRIQELAEQAGLLYTLDSKPTHIDENGAHIFREINVYKNFDPEKFAELIIKECHMLAVGNANWLPKDVSPAAGMNDVFEKYFGVKE